ncbi:MAG: HAD-IA family hydrolase [Nitriliruptoraceae bacterium]
MAARCTITAAAVLFDLDGVLVDSTAAVEGHWRAFADRHGLDGDALLVDLHGRRMVDIMMRAVPEMSAEELEREARRVEADEAAGAADGTRSIHGALALAGALEGRPWAIVTSGTTPVAMARIRAVGLPHPPVLVTGEQVDRGKPDPAPYLLAAQRLGVPPAECVVIEDAPAGLAAGAAAGCTTIGVVTSHAASALGAADHLVDTPADIDVSADTATTLRVRCRMHGR